jgi:hypothetical protein
MSQQPTIVDSLKALPVMVPWFWAILGQVSPMDSKTVKNWSAGFYKKTVSSGFFWLTKNQPVGSKRNQILRNFEYSKIRKPSEMRKMHPGE